MDLFEAITKLETNSELHCARLLILLNTFTNQDGQHGIDGLTKLAKLDFLLRYPVMLERALIARQRSPKPVDVQAHERESVESRMVRYRYGPWDHRYWELLSLLRAKGLLKVSRRGLTKVFTLTSQGEHVAGTLASQEEFLLITKRAKLLNENLNLTPTGLMKFVYSTFPEIASMQLNEDISIEA
jgi:hypothetical protein